MHKKYSCQRSKEFEKLGFVGMNAECKVQSAECRNCVAIILPPSDEGGGKIFDFDGGRDKQNQINFRLSLPQSRIRSTAPSSEGAKENTIKKS